MEFPKNCLTEPGTTFKLTNDDGPPDVSKKTKDDLNNTTCDSIPVIVPKVKIIKQATTAFGRVTRVGESKGCHDNVVMATMWVERRGTGD